jgi:hypothetical protein
VQPLPFRCRRRADEARQCQRCRQLLGSPVRHHLHKPREGPIEGLKPVGVKAPSDLLSRSSEQLARVSRQNIRRWSRARRRSGARATPSKPRPASPNRRRASTTRAKACCAAGPSLLRPPGSGSPRAMTAARSSPASVAQAGVSPGKLRGQRRIPGAAGTRGRRCSETSARRSHGIHDFRLQSRKGLRWSRDACDHRSDEAEVAPLVSPPNDTTCPCPPANQETASEVDRTCQFLSL